MEDELISKNFRGVFGGEITTEIQRKLRRKRLELGLTYTQLAEFFHIHWTTMRKWEGGRVRFCLPRHRRQMQRFIAGECDDLFNCEERQALRKTLVERLAESQSQCCIRQLDSCIRMLQGRPELVVGLLDDISLAVDSALRHFGELAHSEAPVQETISRRVSRAGAWSGR